MDKTSHSLYQTLAEQLESDITNGILKPGTKLPPQRELADFLDINLSTVSKAFKLCVLKGLLSATVGNGTFVSYDALTSGRLQPEHTGQNIIDMGATVPEASGNEILMSLLREMITESKATCLFNYYPQGENGWQKDIAVSLMLRCGHHTKQDQILFANGGQNALTAVLAALFKRGEKIVVDEHTYPGIKTAAAMLGIQLVPVPQDDEGMDTQALEFICKSEKIAGIYVIPACHNPTTVTMSQKRRKRVAWVAEQYDCLLIEDGTYQLMAGGMTAISEYAADRSIYIASLSKAIAPGLRMAYLSVPLQHKNAVSDALYSLNVAVVPMMSELSARIIASGQFETIIENHKKQTAKRNAIVDQWLPKKICRGASGDIFRWLLLPEKYTGAAFERLVLSHGVQVNSADKFAVGKTLPAHAVRLSICAPRDLEQLEQGVKILAQLIR
ncbi:PLP-dependent aminotransferase family protein [Caproiciproducens galactitolivorans]|uniref:aminotransferase-like domain-containing protein n=1 Tax=Caproiciproducens galactitolivorans TaxID=642589 RepID=UPI00240A2AC2|nr:PLP-dependent aminotransferase family protein [Caproiciproducens galactitolivorans]